MLKLRSTVAPNLPIAGQEYSPQAEDQYSNVLRLYFNQLDNFTQNILNNGGGALLSFPYFCGLQDGNTQLTAAIPSPTSTSPIQVASTAGFPSSGYIVIEQEIIGYTTTTATQFDGTITRGALGTTAGKSAHAIGTYATEAQAAPVGTASPMRITNVSVSNGITCTVPDSKFYFTTPGIYNIQFSAQLLNYATSIDNVTIWPRVNGVDIDLSAGVQQVSAKSGTSPGATVAAWNTVNQMNAGDYFEWYWASNTGNTVLATYPPGTSPTRPASPGVFLTVTFVSAA